MSRKVLAAMKDVDPGDLVKVTWSDASIGRSMASGPLVDIPVVSWGVFVALLGERSKHIILAQNSFRYTAVVYDVDYTSVPAPWAAEVEVIRKGEISREIAERLFQSFLAGRCRTIKKRTRNNERMD